MNLFREKLGDNHPDTLGTMSNLASAYDNQGKYRDAMVLYKQCLDKQKAVLGENHPDTLDTMFNLAGAYSDQEKYSDAEIILKQCLDKQKVVLGENHPDTLRTVRNLASLSKITSLSLFAAK